MENKSAMLKLGEDLIGKDPVSVEEAYEAYRNAKVWGVNGGLNKDGYDVTIKLGIETKELREPIAFDRVADTRFVDAALRELGRK